MSWIARSVSPSGQTAGRRNHGCRRSPGRPLVGVEEFDRAPVRAASSRAQAAAALASGDRSYPTMIFLAVMAGAPLRCGRPRRAGAAWDPARRRPARAVAWRRPPRRRRAGEDRVEVEFGDLGKVLGEPSEAQQQVLQGGGVDRWRAAVSGEQRRRAQAAPHPPGVEVGQRHQPQGAVAEQVGLHAAEAGHHQRAEERGRGPARPPARRCAAPGAAPARRGPGRPAAATASNAARTAAAS